MGAETKIQWTDATWNPIRGCSRVSEGCRNCYAEKTAARFSGKGQPYEGLTKNGKWTGKIRFVDEHLDDPLKWKEPRRIFVNSMSDLFHEQLTDQDIQSVFNVMRKAHWHTFQVLTKRPARMLNFTSTLYTYEPLPNVWLGVSVEDQATADERIPLLLMSSAAVRFISAEPLLGHVDLEKIYRAKRVYINSLGGDLRLNWVIAGGESGIGARMLDVQWIRDIVAGCKKNGVPVFVKQLGAHPWESGPGLLDDDDPGAIDVCPIRLKDKKGGDWSEWPDDLKVREFPQ